MADHLWTVLYHMQQSCILFKKHLKKKKNNFVIGLEISAVN